MISLNLVSESMCDQLMDKLLQHYDSEIPIHSQIPSCKSLLEEIYNSREAMDVLEFLAAKKLVEYEMAASNSDIISIRILPKGRTCFEDKALRASEKTEQARRYWITTGIAVIALVKAFFPEISAAWAWLWMILGLR